MQPTKPGSDAPTGIRVTFLDQTGSKSVEAMIAPPVTVARVLPSLITKLNLPITGPDGQPMTYSLDHKEGGRRLRENETLVEAGVADGDHLIVYPEIVAGARLGASVGPSPRQRRLANDLEQLELLASQSTIFSFAPHGPQPSGSPPEAYRVRFRGRGLQQVSGWGRRQTVQPIDQHEVLIQLVAEYPRSAPHMRWLTPIFHPNISAGGAVCLGGWGTHWAPSLQLDRLCEMLWDMLRMANYDTRSPFNPSAAQWLLLQRDFRLPLDHRELRDQPSDSSGWIHFDAPVVERESAGAAGDASPKHRGGAADSPSPDILFLDAVR